MQPTYSSAAPENSIPAFQKAGQAGFYGIECDIYETDQEPGEDDNSRRFIIMHDTTLNRMCGISGAGVAQTSLPYSTIAEKYRIKKGNNVDAYSAEDLRIPTLEEYLDICEQYGVVPVVETKQNLSRAAIHRFWGEIEEKGMTLHG